LTAKPEHSKGHVCTASFSFGECFHGMGIQNIQITKFAFEVFTYPFPKAQETVLITPCLKKVLTNSACIPALILVTACLWS